jgi:phage replication-related protein YjqB (UPF0714/DUF867 family)
VVGQFASLRREPGVVVECVLRSAVGVLAIHGGTDRGTEVVARAVAELSGASFYGVVQPPSLRVHVPSSEYDRAESVALDRFLDHVDVAISVHGYGRDSFRLAVDWPQVSVDAFGPRIAPGQRGPYREVFVGGNNRELAALACSYLTPRFDDFDFVDDMSVGHPLGGRHPRNPVNLPRYGGVQLELPPALRGIGPFGDEPQPTPDPVVDDLVAALVTIAGRAAAFL